MRTAILLAAAFAVGVAAGAFASHSTIKYLRRRVRSLRQGVEPKRMETTKKVIWACLVNGFAWVWCSYVLAALDKVQIAETLSQVALAEIIGSVLAYCLKSAVENLSKNNHWPDKTAPPAASDPDGAQPEVEEPPDVGQ